MHNLLDDRGRLRPASVPYPATFEDIKSTFVDGAPFERRRKLIYRALVLHAELVWEQIPSARLWINGGFTTLKTWEAPKDADVVVVVPVEDYSKCIAEGLIPLWSLLQMTSTQPLVKAPKHHTMGGLVDAFFEADIPTRLAVWEKLWSSVKGPDGKIIEGERKGFVEVRRT